MPKTRRKLKTPKRIRRAKELALVLTGQRDDLQIRVDLGNTTRWLTYVAWLALVDLVEAVIRNESGNTRIARSTIHRLRRSLGPRARGLIKRGGSGEYHLTIAHADVAKRIGITPCVMELVALDLITEERVKALKGRLRRVKLRPAVV